METDLNDVPLASDGACQPGTLLQSRRLCFLKCGVSIPFVVVFLANSICVTAEKGPVNHCVKEYLFNFF